jgi:hypothetical protein
MALIVLAIFIVTLVDDEGYPERRPAARKAERRRHHADDGERPLVDADPATDDVRVGSEHPAPEGVAEHNLRPRGLDAGFAHQNVVAPAEGPSECRRDAENGKQVGAHGRAGEPLGIAAGDAVGGGVGVDSQAPKPLGEGG